MSAHIDHIGIGEPINGDRIYNGAMDDGSGSALLLDMAQSFKDHPEKIRRSILFVFVTAEEKGLLGSKYFAAHPTVDSKSIIADINVDMFLPIVPLKVLRVQGLTDSDLGDRAREVAQAHGVRVQPDPETLRNLFIRSTSAAWISISPFSVNLMALLMKLLRIWRRRSVSTLSAGLIAGSTLACSSRSFALAMVEYTSFTPSTTAAMEAGQFFPKICKRVASPAAAQDGSFLTNANFLTIRTVESRLSCHCSNCY